MTKEQRIEQIEKELAILKQQCREEEEFKFFPQKEEEYWYYLPFSCQIDSSINRGGYKQKVECYKTKEEAERARDTAVAKHKLKQIIKWKNGGWTYSWGEYQSKGNYCFYKECGKIKIEFWRNNKYQPEWMYMKDKQTAEWILDNYRDLVEIVLGE
jgi:hypothetical protein